MNLVTQRGGALARGVVVGRQFWGDINYRCVFADLKGLRVFSKPVCAYKNSSVALTEVFHVHRVQRVCPCVGSGLVIDHVGPYLFV